METLIGITTGDWFKLLRQNWRNVRLTLLPKIVLFIPITLRNSFYKKKEEKEYKEKLQDVKISQSPIFILGHWRSGTTMLHSLMAMDDRFAYPNLFEIYNPHTFLITEEKLAEKLKNRADSKRPMDNVRVNFNTPGEDEFALNILSLKSPMLGWLFPEKEKYYDRYLSFSGVPEEEINQWKGNFLLFVKKLTLKYEKPMLLKSPPHTARIKLLLELFPDAKFIHLRRNPYRVFQSTLQLYEKTVNSFSMQRNGGNGLEENILRRYKLLYDQFFLQKELIPQQNFYELHFEKFENDVVGSVKNIYQHFNLKIHSDFLAKMEQYVQSNKNYKKNEYPELNTEVKEKVYRFCENNFKMWQYPKKV